LGAIFAPDAADYDQVINDGMQDLTDAQASGSVTGQVGAVAKVTSAAVAKTASNAWQSVKNCFPADASVITLDGTYKGMDELRIGDTVLASHPDGTTFFDEIYVFGHADVHGMATYITVDLSSGRSLRLTPDHYLPVIRNDQRVLIPASDVAVGDLVHGITAPLDVGGGAQPSLGLQRVIAKRSTLERGLFNPYTLSGSIIVDDVAASCHSSSALDGMFEAVGIAIPTGYQALFAPLRVLYRILGAKRMASFDFVFEAGAAVMNGGDITFATVMPTCSTIGKVGAVLVAGTAWVLTQSCKQHAA